MKLLEDKILEVGQALDKSVLKVDMFLNHQVDPVLIDACGAEFARVFANDGVTKILTVEASGIPLAYAAALKMGVPFVFAKKGNHSNVTGDVYCAGCHSFTKNKDYTMIVSKKFINKDDTVLIIDDFLANGAASDGLMSIVDQSGAKLAGIGIAVEKGFQPGGKKLRQDGVKLCSLAIIDDMDTGKIVIREQN